MPQPRHFHSVAFPELQELSLDDLKFLNEDSDRLDDFLDNLPMLREQNKTMEDLVANIEEVAGNIPWVSKCHLQIEAGYSLVYCVLKSSHSSYMFQVILFSSHKYQSSSRTIYFFKYSLSPIIM